MQNIFPATGENQFLPNSIEFSTAVLGNNGISPTAFFILAEGDAQCNGS
jgi:hypothetical protein